MSTFLRIVLLLATFVGVSIAYFSIGSVYIPLAEVFEVLRAD